MRRSHEELRRSGPESSSGTFVKPREASTTVGVDLVQISHIADSMQRFGERFLEKVYTEDELSYCLSDPGSAVSRLAARFAAKEAARKVLRIGEAGLGWRSIEVVRATEGWCDLALHGDAAALADQRGLFGFSVCLSHEGDYATAVVLAERGQGSSVHAR